MINYNYTPIWGRIPSDFERAAAAPGHCKYCKGKLRPSIYDQELLVCPHDGYNEPKPIIQPNEQEN